MRLCSVMWRPSYNGCTRVDRCTRVNGGIWRISLYFIRCENVLFYLCFVSFFFVRAFFKVIEDDAPSVCDKVYTNECVCLPFFFFLYMSPLCFHRCRKSWSKGCRTIFRQCGRWIMALTFMRWAIPHAYKVAFELSAFLFKLPSICSYILDYYL